MIPNNLRIVLIIAVISYFIIILAFLKSKAISLKYTLLWIVAGLAMAAMVAFPDFLSYIVNKLGIVSNMNGLFISCIAFIIIILMSITSIVSRQTNKIRSLTQSLALLEKRIRDLENSKKQNE